MPSPFPGMDPWLELSWRDVHASLIIYIRDQLQLQLPEPLIARAEESVSVDIEEERTGSVRPDVAAGVNLVEIDLVRKGDWVFSVDETAFPPGRRATYAICVFRATRPNERALYPLPLREPLPRMAIPLRPRDRDVVLDLQQVVNEAYERGRYDRTDYRRPLDPPLPPDDAAWATDLLRKAVRL